MSIVHWTNWTKRERARGDRRIGQAKNQLDFVHKQNERYDVEVNTYENSIEDCAKTIESKFNEWKSPKEWLQTITNFKPMI
ncbi:hypothetical protein J7I93_20775 [Bacillus sp. ISL-47]|uniref:phosphotransferase-like protein n=1 Tax=Bacillus sp. ISL-47 TaxID=2819130 RepID=UPI001BEC501B|nr:hypothetical protein [Bacillus sp. ISL-47]MBT2708150.1 hypothetical protein [Pseudomonas sp. ISL-84]